MMKKIPICLFLLLSSFALTQGVDVYKITDTVRRAEPPKFGANFGLTPFKPWEGGVYWNCWSDFYSMEPIVFRWTFTATGGGADFIENIKDELATAYPERDRYSKSPGAGFWYMMEDGFWDGAQVDVYRETPEGLVHIRRDRVKAFKSPARGQDGEQRLDLENTGEPIQAGDIYDLLMYRDEVPEGVDRESRRHGFFAPSKDSAVTWRIDRSTHAPEHGSTASMRIDLPGSDEPVGMCHQYFRWEGKESNFLPGKSYRLDVWMKGEVDAPVILQVGDRGTREVEVTPEWTHYSVELDNETPITEQIGWLLIGSTGKGTLWMDNMIVTQTDLEPFEIYPHWVEALKEFQPGMIRDMGGRGMLTVENYLKKNQFERNLQFMRHGLMSGWRQGNMTLPHFLELCRDTGANPYIMTYVLWTDEEIDLFMEYLGGPITTKGGKIRAEQGYEKPWTQVFDRLYIECANEMWNGIFLPQAFPSQPEVAGKVSDRLFKRIQASPYAGEHFRYVASAFVNSLYRWREPSGDYNMGEDGRAWTFRNMITCPSANAIGTAPSGYIGGWDGDTPVGQNDDELFQSNLFYSAQIMEKKLVDILAMQEELTDVYGRGRFEMIKYEAGPGYALPNPERPFMEEAERIGKSLALGTATLDSFMFVIANNGNSNFFKFVAGNNWTSHNHQMLPHNTFLALSLRNRYCKGDLLWVKDQEVATVDIAQMQAVGLDNQGKRSEKIIEAVSDVPLTRLYAFKEGERYSFLALNRSATQAKTLKLELPYKPQSDYTLYSYSAEDIRATNRQATTREDMPIRIVKTSGKGFQNGYVLKIPPASAVVLVNEAR